MCTIVRKSFELSMVKLDLHRPIVCTHRFTSRDSAQYGTIHAFSPHRRDHCATLNLSANFL